MELEQRTNSPLYRAVYRAVYRPTRRPVYRPVYRPMRRQVYRPMRRPMHRSICRDAPPTVGRYRGMDATSGQRGGCTVSATRRITTGRTISTQTNAVGMASW